MTPAAGAVALAALVAAAAAPVQGCYPLDVRVESGRTNRLRIAFGEPCR